MRGDWIKKLTRNVTLLEQKVDVLEELAHELFRLYRLQKEEEAKIECNVKIENYITIDDLKYFESNIFECFPILRNECAERKTTWKFLKIVEEYISLRGFIEMPVNWQLFLYTFAVEYENCTSVEEYATDKTVNFEMHSMALKAREIVRQLDDGTVDYEMPSLLLKAIEIFCQLDESNYEKKSTLREKLKIETEKKRQQRIFYDFYCQKNLYGITEGVHFYETVILTDNPVTVGWETLTVSKLLKTVNRFYSVKPFILAPIENLTTIKMYMQTFETFDAQCNSV